MQPVQRLGAIFVLVLVALYVFVVAAVAVVSFTSDAVPTFQPWVGWVIIGAGGALATIFGGTMGVQVENGGLTPPKLTPPFPGARATAAQAWPLYVIATYGYAIALFIALLGVIGDGIKNTGGSPNTAPELFSLFQTALGTAVAVALVFARPPAPPPAP